MPTPNREKNPAREIHRSTFLRDAGFFFNKGAGTQYNQVGWACSGLENNGGHLNVDTGRADPWEQITASQTSKKETLRPAEESLCALAFGAAGRCDITLANVQMLFPQWTLTR